MILGFRGLLGRRLLSCAFGALGVDNDNVLIVLIVFEILNGRMRGRQIFVEIGTVARRRRLVIGTRDINRRQTHLSLVSLVSNLRMVENVGKAQAQRSSPRTVLRLEDL